MNKTVYLETSFISYYDLGDPIVKEVREIREKIAAEHNNDIEAIGRYYQEKQKQEVRKPVVLSPSRPAEPPRGIRTKSRQNQQLHPAG